MKMHNIEHVKHKLKFIVSSFNSASAIKIKFQSMGSVMILLVYGVMATNNTFYLFGSDVSAWIKLLMLSTVIVGLFYLLFTNTTNFKLGSIGLYLLDDIDSHKTLVTLKEKKIILKRANTKYDKRRVEKLEFIPVSIIDNDREQNKIIASRCYEYFEELIKGRDIARKISLTSLNEKNIFVYSPIFDFFDKIIVGGINGLYGKTRNELFRLVIGKFTKNGEEFDYSNLRKRYSEWLKLRNLIRTPFQP